jgi:uncharacterized metal-binding protein YceD (DUF177 family)
MLNSEEMNIDLKSLTEGDHEFAFSIDDSFFQNLSDAEIQHGKVNATAAVHKTSDSDYTLTLTIDGEVTVMCDLCLDDMQQPVSSQSTYIVTMGQEPSDNDDVITIDENKGILELEWLIYETIALAVPIKHVHAPGKCNAAMTEKLKELSATRSGDGEDEDDIDPRWAELKKLQ